MPRSLCLALAVLSVLLASCGGSSASGGGDPASAVPADAALYFDATVRPEGSLREDALAAAGRVLRTSDPQGEIDELVRRAFAETEDPRLDYHRDVAPWLGEKVALWAAAGSGDEGFRGAVVAAATDEEEARAALDRAVEAGDETFTERSFEDVDYRATAESAVGVVEGFAVIGTEAEFKRTVAAVKGDGLDSSERFKAALDGLEDERLGTLFVDVKAIVDQAVPRDPEAAEQLEQARRLVPFDRIGPVAGAFVANGERLAVDTVAEVPEDALPGALGGDGSTPLVGELPGEAWLAGGSPDFGATVKAFYEQAAGAIGGAAIEGQLRQELGLDLQEDVFSWIGDVAFFARGTSMDALDGGVVIEATDPGKAEAAFGKLVGLAQARGGVSARPVEIDGAETAFEVAAPGAPKPVVAARSDDRVVIAAGRGAAAAALGGGERLADTDLYGDAKSVLGDAGDPSFLLSMPAVLELVQATGSADAHYAQAKPYLEAFGVLAAGSSRDGDTARARFVATLR